MTRQFSLWLISLPICFAATLLLLSAGCGGKKKSSSDSDSGSESESDSQNNPILDARNRTTSQNNLKQIGLAFQIHHDAFGALPNAAICDDSGTPLLSWRVLLLPYLEQQQLYKQFNLKEAWDSPTNKPLLAQMPKVYANPGRTTDKDTVTFYRVIAALNPPTSPQPLFIMPVIGQGKPQERRLFAISDGTSNTIMAVEAEEGVPWTKPDELIYNPKDPLPRLYYYANGTSQILLADGSTRSIKKSISEKTLRSAITIDDGGILGNDW